MSRFAFVVPPLAGHVNPTVSVATELCARGHEAAWIGHGHSIGHLLPPGALLHSLPPGPASPEADAAMARSRTVRGLDSLRLLWDDFLVPLARSMLPGVEEAVATLRPDVLVVDQQAVAGSLAARRASLPWASLCTTSAGVTDPLAGLGGVKAWMDGRRAQLQLEAGLPVAPGHELSPQLVVVFSTEALVGPLERFPPHYRFVGPSLHARTEDVPFPLGRLHPGRRHVLVSLGTISAERRDGFFDTVVAALEHEPSVQAIVIAAPELLARTPDPAAEMIVLPRVPQVALLPRMDAVVCHAGHNTVCEALAHGLPLVVAPIRDDQPVVAGQVTGAGCGLRVRYGRLSPQALRDAVVRVLDETAFREAARRVQASFATAGGAKRAAELLEGLAGAVP